MSNENNNELNQALAEAQAAVFAATKDATNPHFGSKYATLAEVLNTVRDPLAKSGFALVQDADTDLNDMTVGVVTRLLHKSGGAIESKRLSCPLRPEYSKNGTELKPSIQQIGAMVTYLRRYSLCSFLSVAVEDDDGNSASSAGTNAPPPTQPQPSPKGNRTSAHTGQPLDTPEAVAAHHAAAKQAQQPPAQPPQAQQPAQAQRMARGVNNPDLASAMFAASLTVEGLEGYLRGTLGQPRITKPMLIGNMSINTLGAPIVAAMLKPANWQVIVERIHADTEYTPF